jgi:hypothetical protein
MGDIFDTHFPHPSHQLQTVISYLRGIANQDIDTLVSQLTDDHQYEWIARGFDKLGPRIKNREQTEQLYSSLFGNFVKDYKVRIQRIPNLLTSYTII